MEAGGGGGAPITEGAGPGDVKAHERVRLERTSASGSVEPRVCADGVQVNG